jgi:nicotinate-nucleotide adenylyltransferase
LGGTFDPPHLAHLIAGEAAYRQFGLDVVTFVPAGSPWQKADTEVTEAARRLEMTRISVEGVEYFEVDDQEVKRPGWSYTIDTLEEYPEADELVLIVGADVAMGLRTWHRWQDVLERAELAVAPRPGAGRHEVASAIGVPFRWLDMAPLDMSATDVRERAREGMSIRFYVREAVWRYVVEQKVYG